ncbi:hypothetical protein [Sporolactobacillus terrae]|uniref:hypothetical protein n=1 Tax=Sporolactobacillus terrae TaxID=269673 RepID=UPI001CBB9121|nr:hypothetical protein [Sporolactobacillus terrae]UAK17566.1 hypothetical protein K7399_06465 [Sporolactobacillus terrae]
MPAINWTEWSEGVIEQFHGHVWFYRDLYEGKHADLFPRAKNLIDKGEITDQIMRGRHYAQNVQTPYIIANISKLIPEIPAMLVSRSIGKISSSIHSDSEQNDAANKETDEQLEAPHDAENSQIDDLQQELIQQIEKNSGLQMEHWSNIVQQQVDGGLVGVVWNDERGLRIETKQRDVYFPHEDGLGADLAYQRKIGEDFYLHIYRERVEEDGLRATNMLYKIDELSAHDEKKAAGGFDSSGIGNYSQAIAGQLEPVDDDTAMELLEMDELETFYPGRNRPFIVYWPNDKTFMHPLGVSCLKGQEGKQDEINWSLTRNAIVYERNGKPRIAVSKEIMQALQNNAFDRYGDEKKIDHRDLEVTTFDENGKALEVIQIDITKIGDVAWVKDLERQMLAETQTSEKALDLFSETTQAQSGIAKYYDLFVSLCKAERLRNEYVYFLKQLFENCLWLANQDDSAVQIEQPEIATKEMFPVTKSELITQGVAAHTGGGSSLETLVRTINPDSSEEWIQEEVQRIEAEKQSDDSTSLAQGRANLSNYMDNRDEDGKPIEGEEDDE